jgi:hypothetical protein
MFNCLFPTLMNIKKADYYCIRFCGREKIPAMQISTARISASVFTTYSCIAFEISHVSEARIALNALLICL